VPNSTAEELIWSSHQERKKLLSFVIVGGGPTGVEVAAELHDMIRVCQAAVHRNMRCFNL
jgi:NADH dehydrogenase FAD-containing subunit